MGTAAAAADPAALFEANEPLALWLAKRFWPTAQAQGVAFEDLVQDCRVALWLAALHFDPGRRIAFSTYSCTTIRNYVFSRTLKRRAMDVPPAKLVRLDALATPIAGPAVDAGAALEHVEELTVVLRGLAELPQRERVAVLLFFGIGTQPQPMREIGERLGLSRSRVGQLVAAALRKLRRTLGA
jgi:RNA polymerase primary sigma factor